MKIALSPMDYYFFRRNLYTIQSLFEYQGRVDAAKLRQGLDEVLRHCPAPGSQLKIISDREVVLETGYEIPLSVHTLAEDSAKINPDEFFDTVINVEEQPLVKLRLTHTPSKSFVGVTMSHMVGDGSSFFQFMTALSDVIRGKADIAGACNDRSLLSVDATLAPPLSLFNSTGYVTPRPPHLPSYQAEEIFYSHQELADMKRRYHSSDVKLSENDILMADLTKRFHRDVPLHDGRFLVRCPVDYRNRFGLPANYFGNAVRDAVASFDPEEIDALSLSEVAVRIKRAILSVDKRSVYKSLLALEQFRQQHGIKMIESIGCPGLLVTNLSKLPVHLVDLGSGRPIGFHQASVNPRVAVIQANSNGLDVQFKRPLLPLSRPIESTPDFRLAVAAR